MKKKLLSLALVFGMVISMLPSVALAAGSNIAYASTQKVELDGKKVTFEMYALRDADGNATNYVKLRDVAFMLRGTAAQFSVDYDGAIKISTGEIYTYTGSELWTPFSGDRAYQSGSGTVIVDGTPVNMEAIVLTDDDGGGYTYFKLRDLGAALGFKVDWTADRGVIVETGPVENLSDKALFARAAGIVRSAAWMGLNIANANFFDIDYSDSIMVDSEYGSDKYYRVIGCDTIAEAEDAAREYWYALYSRMAPSFTDHELEMMRNHFVEQNGRLYWQELGVGDDFGYEIDQMISRTADEAVFSAHMWTGHSDDVFPFYFSLILENGDWKYLEHER